MTSDLNDSKRSRLQRRIEDAERVLRELRRVALAELENTPAEHLNMTRVSEEGRLNMARSRNMEFLDQMLAGWLRLTVDSQDVDSNVWGAVSAFKRAVRDDRRPLLHQITGTILEQERRDAAKQKTPAT